MTAPVERWIRGAAERCAAIGLPELARALRGHARAEAGHDIMMIADARSLAARWNSRRKPSVDADILLNQAATLGVVRYCEVHDQNLAGATPYAQIAIEDEVEMLPLRYGALLVSHCLEVLGAEVLPCLTFVTEHIVLDAGHTDFNARAIAKLLDLMPACLPALVAAGTAILDAYAQFLTDCAQLAEHDSRNSRALTSAGSRPLSWHMRPPVDEACERGGLSPRIGLTRSGRFADRSSSRAADDPIFILTGASPTLIRLTSTPTTSWHTSGRGSLAVFGCIA